MALFRENRADWLAWSKGLPWLHFKPEVFMLPGIGREQDGLMMLPRMNFLPVYLLTLQVERRQRFQQARSFILLALQRGPGGDRFFQETRALFYHMKQCRM